MGREGNDKWVRGVNERDREGGRNEKVKGEGMINNG